MAIYETISEYIGKDESVNNKLTNRRVKAPYRTIAIGLVVLMLAIACTPKAPKQLSDHKTSFVLPEIPALLTTAEQRSAYLIAHYWDNFNFADTTLINNAEITEQALVDYINNFEHTTAATVGMSIKAMLNKAIDSDKSMYYYFVELYEKYLYDPNSPFRNENYYISILQSIVHSDELEEIDKTRARYQLEMALKNRPGDIAADFEFVLKSGRKMKLSNVDSENIILFFNNPDCHECARAKEILASFSNSNTKIIAIYPDQELELWQKTEYPSGWINGSNSTIRQDNSYDLRAIPNLYLLDKDRRVILKDVPIEAIINYHKAYLSN